MKKRTNKELGRLSPEEFKEATKMPVVVVLDNVRSAYNVGSVFRTCDAFPVQALYLCGITCYPPHKEILKTALGSHETVVWKKLATTLECMIELKQMGYKIYAIEQAEESISLNDIALKQLKNEKIALVFGHEVEGVHQEVMNVCDGCLEIPQGGTKHSLNIAVCAGVVLWEFFRK